MPLEKVYVLATARLESKDVVSLEILDQTSQPPIVKTAVFRIGTDEYAELGKPTVGSKLKVTVSVAAET